MARDIQGAARKMLDSDTARAIAANAVGEAIRRVGTTRNQASEAASNIRLPAAGGFAAGAGAATVAMVTARRIGRLIIKPKRPAVLDQSAAKVASGARKTAQAPRDAVEAFTSKLGSSSSGGGARRSASATSRSKPTATGAKRGSASSGQKSPAKAAKATRGSSGSGASSGRSRRASSAQSKSGSTTASRGSSSKRARSSNGSSRRATAQSSRSPNGTSKSSSAKRSRSAQPR